MHRAWKESPDMPEEMPEDMPEDMPEKEWKS